MRNVLCRHCFRLFRYDEIGVICRSDPCARVLDVHGDERPRYMRAKGSGLWRRWRRRLDLDAPCPFCRQVDTLAPACPLCRGQLDVGIGRVDDKVIAVIGASDSGKSHFLATVLHQLQERKAGGDVWDVSMKPEDLALYRRELYEPLFEDGQELEATPAELRPELRLTLENRNSAQKTLLVFRDLGGEVFQSPGRLQDLTFLRYAQGVVLMADPLAFEPPDGEAGSGGEVIPWSRNDRPTAVEVLDVYRRVLETQVRYPEHRSLPLLPDQKFLAVAITKADLVLSEGHRFWRAEEDRDYLQPGYWARRDPENESSRAWVRKYLGRELAEIAGAFADVGYFFVSSYGYPHQPHTPLRRPPEPRRVHEPIFGLLDRFAASSPGQGAADDSHF